MNRNDISKHTTQNVILRIDYVSLTNEEVEEIKSSLANLLISDDEGFSSHKEVTMRSVDFQINDSNIENAQDFLNIKKTMDTLTHEFYKINEEGNIYLKLIFNKYYLAIEIMQNVKYCAYESYNNTFLKAINQIKEKAEAFIINRIGFRKFNAFFVTKETDISNYVNETFFNHDCSILVNNPGGYESQIAEKIYQFKIDSRNINLTTHVSIGILNDEPARRVAFDTDIYMNEREKLDSFFGNNLEELNNVNDLLFEIYLKLIKERFINMLKSENEIDQNIILGVNDNE